MAKRGTFDVFVGNLPADATDRNVGKIFSRYGEIQGIFVKESSNSANLKYAFVKFLCETDADKACAELNNQEVEGKKVTVRRQESRKSTRPGGKDGEKLGKILGASKFQQQPDIVPEGVDVESVSSVGSGGNEYREKEAVMITHVENPILLWTQLVNDENTNRLMNMSEQLATLCPAAAKVNGPPQQNKIYAAQYSEDLLWYRCVVRQNVSQDKLRVQYIDYGNYEEIPASSLVEIPPSIAAVKPLACKLQLHNIRANSLNDQKAIGFLRNSTEGKVVQVAKTRQMADGNGHYGILYVDGMNFNTLLMEEGHATTKRQMKPMSEHMGGYAPQIGGSGEGMGMQKFGDIGSGRLGVGVGAFSRMSDMSAMQKMKSSGYSEDQSLKKDLTAKKKEIEKLRGELAKRELQLQQANANKVQLNSVLDLAEKIRQLRIQFPVGRASGLEEAIGLALSEDKVQHSSVSTLQPVVSSISLYKAAQKEICACKDQKELEGLIEMRDSARVELHGKLQVCIEELVKMPLEERYNAVKHAEQKLCDDYKGFLAFNVHGCPQLEDLVHGFKDWKSRKEQEFEDWRVNTDKCKKKMVDSLHQLADMLSFENATQHRIRIDLDGLLRSYSQALNEEITVTDLEHSPDGSMIATVLTAILKELRGELKTLESLKNVVSDFRQLQNSITPWLDDKPNQEEIMSKKKEIRGLKSKLRHKEADRQDLEEAGDSTDEELLKVEEEVKEMKHKLHLALLEMDDMLEKLAKNSDEHFPELILKNQDVGIEVQLAFGGLVKIGRELEHYTLTPSFCNGFSSSVFAGKPVFVQELMLGGADHLSKEELLDNVNKYAETVKGSDYLLGVDAVFFSKNDKQAYIQMERPELCSLTEFVKDNPITDKVRQKLFYGVTAALTTLHSKCFVHGEVNPSNIAVKSDGSTILLPPEFSRSSIERVRKRYVTENGLRFQPLEMVSFVQQGLMPQVSLDCDMYNLGLLLLWLYNPHGIIELQGDGSPMVHGLNLDSITMKLLYSQLCPNPNSRLPASHVLRSVFLTRVVSEPEPVKAEPSEPVTDEQNTDNTEQETQEVMKVPLADDDDDLPSENASESTDNVDSLVTGEDILLQSQKESEDTMTNIGVFQVESDCSVNSNITNSNCVDTNAVDRLAEHLACLPPVSDMTVFSSSESNFNNTAAALSSFPDTANTSETWTTTAQPDVTSQTCDSNETSSNAEESIDSIALVSSFAGQQSFLKKETESPLNALLKTAGIKDKL